LGLFNTLFRTPTLEIPMETFAIQGAEERASVTYADWSLSGGWMDGDSFNTSGESVTGYSSWRLPAVYRSIALISETIAMLPFNLLETKDNGNKFPAKNHKTYNIYKSEPNQFQTWFDLKLHLVSQALTYGNGYAYIRRDSQGSVVSFEHLSAGECVPYYLKTGTMHFLYYYVFGEIVEARDIIHIKCMGSDGVIGRNPIEIARETIGAGLAQQSFTGSMYKNGLNLQGALEHPATLSDAAQNRLRNQMDKFRGAGNGFGTITLEEGLKYNAISIKPIDAQFIESRKFTIEDISRMYGVPLHKLNELSKATNNNIEHQDLEFYKNCISPWEERIEQEFDRKVLLSKEKGRFKHEFDNSKLLRTDTKSRMEWINGMFTKGAISPNEIRVIEGLNAVDNPKMDETYMQLAMSTVDDLDRNNGSENNKDNGAESKAA
jgi:HK97 family phage portal protein